MGKINTWVLAVQYLKVKYNTMVVRMVQNSTFSYLHKSVFYFHAATIFNFRIWSVNYTS